MQLILSLSLFFFMLLPSFCFAEKGVTILYTGNAAGQVRPVYQ
ncbi:hypothetical protein [Desulfonema limicola]|nr:hypothetical protein [Desulfonema limicola]